MKKLLLASALFSVLAFSAHQAQAAVITFDDLARGIAIPNGYAGLNWDNFYTKSDIVYDGGSGYANGVVSPEIVVLNWNAAPASFYAKTPFTLNSGYFTAAWNDALEITLKGSLGGTELYTKTFTADTASPVFMVFDWGKVDHVTLSTAGGILHAGYTYGGTQMAMDSLNVSTVPLPAALPLFGFAVAGVAAYRRRKAA